MNAAAEDTASTKIERALAYIRQHGTARSPELAKHCDIDQKNVTPLLSSAVERGYLISCRIERPNLSPIIEYRLSATVSDSKVSWREFKLSKRPATYDKPLKAKAAPPIRKGAGKLVPVEERVEPVPITKHSGDENPVSETRPAAPVPEFLRVHHQDTATLKSKPLGDPGMAVGRIVREPVPITRKAAEDRAVQPTITVRLDNSGQLIIKHQDAELLLSPENTRELGQFLIDTEPVWN